MDRKIIFLNTELTSREHHDIRLNNPMHNQGDYYAHAFILLANLTAKLEIPLAFPREWTLLPNLETVSIDFD